MIKECKKIQMIGYNNIKAIAMYHMIKMMPIFIITLVISFFALIFSLIFQIYELLFIFILPTILVIVLLFNILKTYLKYPKTKHIFCLENGKIYKDEKIIKNTNDIHLYKFKNFLLFEFEKSSFCINNNDFLTGSREEFLSLIHFYNNHTILTLLPLKSDEEIIDLLFKDVTLKGKQRLFYSKDKRKIIYIYKNSVGSFSVGYEKLYIAYDEERYFSNQYGWYEPDFKSSISFYGTCEEAFKDIENEIDGYIEMK